MYASAQGSSPRAASLSGRGRCVGRIGGPLATVTTKSTTRKKPARRTTTPATSRSSRASSTSGSAPACTSAPPAPAVCTTSSTRSSTTPSTRRWPARATKIVVTIHADGSVSVQDNGRGIPVKPIPRRQGPPARRRGRPHHAERRREVRRRRLLDLRRPPRRRRLGRERPVGEADGRGPARRLHVAPGVRAGQADRPSSIKGKASTKTGTTVRFWPDPEIFTETLEFKRESSPSACASSRS